jgi:hypothetical protein
MELSWTGVVGIDRGHFPREMNLRAKWKTRRDGMMSFALKIKHKTHNKHICTEGEGKGRLGWDNPKLRN